MAKGGRPGAGGNRAPAESGRTRGSRLRFRADRSRVQTRGHRRFTDRHAIVARSNRKGADGSRGFTRGVGLVAQRDRLEAGSLRLEAAGERCATGSSGLPTDSANVQALAPQVNMSKLLKLWKIVLLTRRHENHPLSTRVQLESLLLQYQQLFED